MNLSELKHEIISSAPDEIYHKYLTGNEIWFFKEKLNDSNYSSTYDNFKRYITKQLNIGFNEIAIFGSAKIGLSLSPNPQKTFRTFHSKSDIDLALISKSYYNEFWEARLKLYYEDVENQEYSPFAKDIFRRFINMNNFPEQHPLFREWSKKIDPFQKHLDITFGMGEYDVNYRIFESWSAVEDYYISGISKVKERLIRGDII